jgi:type IV pilus assembly protein PilC
MPKFEFKAIDATGQEITDVIEASTQEEAQATIRQMGYYPTKISAKREKKQQTTKKSNNGKTMALGKVRSGKLTEFTRQLSVLQDAGLPILRSLEILQKQAKNGALRNALIDTCEEIQSGSGLSEAMAKSPRAFDRLYVNMIKAGEAGGALEVILQRLAEFLERSERLKRKIKGAMTYPIAVVGFACMVLLFIMLWLVPKFQAIFEDFGTELPGLTLALISVSSFIGSYWFLLPIGPIGLWLTIKFVCKFRAGRRGWHGFTLQIPIFGKLFQMNIVARITRTLGTLVASGVPILEAIHITRETAGNAIFEHMLEQVQLAIREGETIAKPMLDNKTPPINIVAGLFWFFLFFIPGVLIFLFSMRRHIMDEMVIHMVEVGEETGELDTMLYKVADVYDERVNVMTESLTSLLEPLLIMGLGVMVGTIVIALFLPMIKLITELSG